MHRTCGLKLSPFCARGFRCQSGNRSAKSSTLNRLTGLAGYHMGWGMGVRNALREHGFGEEPFGVRNLDNIYVPLIEEAVTEQDTSTQEGQG